MTLLECQHYWIYQHLTKYLSISPMAGIISILTIILMPHGFFIVSSDSSYPEELSVDVCSSCSNLDSYHLVSDLCIRGVVSGVCSHTPRSYQQWRYIEFIHMPTQAYMHTRAQLHTRMYKYKYTFWLGLQKKTKTIQCVSYFSY